MDTQNTPALRSASEKLQNYRDDGEAYVRANPTQSALVATGVGFLLAQLPLRYMMLAFLKLALLLIKPATFIYAISKLMEDFSDQNRA